MSLAATVMVSAAGAAETVGHYERLRHFADSWGLLALTIFFVGIVLYTLRPGSRRVHDDIADIPFRHEDRPAPTGRVEPRTDA